jgi:hypothetical protein
MSETPTSLREQQFALARHVRDPAANPPPPGIEERRLAIYRELFFNSIESLLAGNFPVIRKTLGDADWHALVRDFHADFRCRTPLFTEIGREFIQFLEQRALEEREDGRDPPWLHDLAHYEWVELALQIADDPVPAHVADGDLLDGIPVISPFARALAYRWPVQRIGPGHRPDVASEAPTLLLVRRDAAGSVHFSELSPLVYRLLELLGQDRSMSGHDALQQLADEAKAMDAAVFYSAGTLMLHRLHDEGVLLGTQPV